MQETVGRGAALTLEECLLRASSPEREVESSQEAKNTGQTEEAKGKQKPSGSVSFVEHSMPCGEGMEKCTIAQRGTKGHGEHL